MKFCCFRLPLCPAWGARTEKNNNKSRNGVTPIPSLLMLQFPCDFTTSDLRPPWEGRTRRSEGPHNGSNESVSQIGISSPPSVRPPHSLTHSRHFSTQSQKMEMEAAAAKKKKIYSQHENPPRNLIAIRRIGEFLGGPVVRRAAT